MKKLLKSITLFASMITIHGVTHAQQISADKKAVTSYIALHPSERSRANEIPRELVTEFDPSVFPIDSELKFNFAGEATNAKIVVTGSFFTTQPPALAKKWIAANGLLHSADIKLTKGANHLVLTDIPVHKAAEYYVDNYKKGAAAEQIALTYTIFVKDKEIGSLQKVYPAHIIVPR